ncbi:hypothetical protein M0812_29851 [Anaeramoeba flamelloides]|uniref:Uncharacterized protein n=1 Tax=Anaeramoeba flamelloides TaxID=1746091 RepID=A0AAV7Y0N7_9EUKA|nr:hypothetical protein M0812_29851 [Anaeramoeba flamelloides]
MHHPINNPIGYQSLTLDSEGLIGEPVSYTSDLDAVETVRSPAIEWVGDNYFFITYQVSDFDDHERGVAGQLFEAKEDENIELIGDRLEISKSWKNGDESMSRDRQKV